MSKIKVLFLAANPAGTERLQLDEEIRQITARIRASEHRDSLELISRWAVRPDDLLQALLEEKPHIVHFSGHGSSSAELYFLGERGRPKRVTKKALVELFRILKDNVRVVVLNACYSRPQAEAIAETIDCTIGMNRPIGDRAAIAFAGSFYRALGFGRSVQEAFDLGRASLLLEGIAGVTTPELIARKGVDASGLVLIAPPRVPTTPVATEPKAKPPGERTMTPNRVALMRDLSRLAPSDWALLKTAIPGAAPHIGRHGTVAEQVEELIQWAESPTGPGLAAVEEAFEVIRNPR